MLGVDFDWVVTSGEIGEYKPSLRNFRTGVESDGGGIRGKCCTWRRVCYHDVEPARALGLATVWVNRAGARSTPLRDVRPDVEVGDLGALVELMRRGGG